MIENKWLHTVEWGECDPAGIVFYPNIYGWFDTSSHQMMKVNGFGQSEMISRHGIVGFPLIETHAQFLKPMTWDEEVAVHSHIEKFSHKTFTIRHRIYNISQSEVLCVDGYEIRIWGMKDNATGVMNAWALPEEFTQALA